ncbi:MAG: DVUA0089 family protein [Deltaproteobacteria bacterium]|nr:DVUA0089 family protein [Deltaproteobacteria bacterium]
MRRGFLAMVVVLASGCVGGVDGVAPGPLPDLGNKDPAGSAENCSNGADDDGDMVADCGDLDCMGLAVCGGGLAEDCTNVLDDDGDGWIDCDDSDCWSATRCAISSEFTCDDGADNDGDGAKDCEDADCVSSPACGSADPAEDCGNGADDDDDATVDCEDQDCMDHPACRSPEICGNDADDDGDGVADCDDADCVDAPACTGGDEPEPEPDPEPDPEVCGNGLLEGEEECDDGNAVAGDGCAAGCVVEVEEVVEGDDGTVQPVESGNSVDAEIAPVGDDDWYKIDLAEGARLTVETSDGNGGCSMDTIAQLFGATRPNPLPTSTGCSTETGDLACDDDGGEGLCSFLDYTATAAGFVHVRILEFGGNATGTYHVTFTVTAPPGRETTDEWESNDTPGAATTIVDGDLVEGEIDTADDEDWFAVELEASQTLRLETSDGLGACSFDSVLFVYEPDAQAPTSTTCYNDDTALECNDDDGNGTCSLLEYTALEAGEYLVRLISYSKRATGSYLMSVAVE